MSELKNSNRLKVVLVGTRNPLNIGAAARAMSNFGFLELRVVNPYEVAFREARSAVGGSPVLKSAKEYATLAEAVADCSLVVGTTAARKRGMNHTMRVLKDGAAVIRRRLTKSTVALVFGSEKRGLSNEDLSHCHWLMHIPTREVHLSMNLGQSVAVCLYELIRAATPVKTEKSSSAARAAELERITTLLFEMLDQSGYVQPRTRISTEEKTRRLLRRISLSAPDAELLLGMLRQISWKLNSGSSE